MDRRSFVLVSAGSALLSTGVGRALAAGLPAGAIESGSLETLPGKVPLIKRSFRPPNYETPVDLFDSAITPNRAFFVRWHLADIPDVDSATWRLQGRRRRPRPRPAEYSLDELKRGFDNVELVAVCQCSGNRRGLSDPHVPGVEWGYGAVGNARWKGVRLRDVLNKAGVKKDAVEIAFERRGQGHPFRHARLPEEPPDVEGDGREHAPRMGDERRAAAAPERRAAAGDRARLDGDLLDEDADVDRRARQAVQLRSG